MSVPLLLVFILTGGRGIGGGDVKLMAVCGLFLGWKHILVAFLLGCVLGSVIHLLRMRFAEADRVLAMGPYLALGVFIALLWGPQLLHWYLSMY
ncbi:MAG: prepilin peptidase [Syntrophomonadaceae bacterium]|nr:prepilin peptidase [Syntrophomonadaceae bacterium]